MRDLLPSYVSWAGLAGFANAGAEGDAEAASLGDAGPGRAAEFAAGRHCARAALAALGMPGTAVPRGADRGPVWPAGVVGAITHCDGYAAAAVARACDVRAIGIDAEPDAPLPERVRRRVLRPGEARRLPATPGVSWDRLVFSAKESVYKAWAPLTGSAWLGFGDAEVAVDPVRGRLRAVLRVPSPFPHGLTGRYVARSGLLLTAIVVRGAS